jgi:hypothetical protein
MGRIRNDKQSEEDATRIRNYDGDEVQHTQRGDLIIRATHGGARKFV